MDLPTRRRAYARRGLATPRDLIILSDARDDAARRWVYATGLSAVGASSVTTRLARAAAGLALDGLPDASSERDALARSIRRHAVYDRAALAERAPYGRPPRPKHVRGALGDALHAATQARRTPLALEHVAAGDRGAVAALFARAGLTRALGVVLEGVAFDSSLRIRALEAIPETVHPGSYAALLPSAHEEADTTTAYDDGLDDLEVDDALKPLVERSLADRALLDPLWEDTKEAVDTETLTRWYRDRALAIDDACGCVAHSEALLALAKDRLPAQHYASLLPLHRDCWQLARLLALDALRDRRESLESWRARSHADQLNEASKHVERPETLASYASEAVALRTVLGPLVCGRFVLPCDAQEADPLLSSISDVSKRAIQDRGDFGVALAACRASAYDIAVGERLVPSQGRLARFVVEISRLALGHGNAVHVCAQLLACLASNDADRSIDEDEAFFAREGPKIWSAVDDLQERVRICEVLRDGCRVFADLGTLTGMPRLSDEQLDRLAPACAAEDLAVLAPKLLETAARRFVVKCVLKERCAPADALDACEAAGQRGLWSSRDHKAALHCGRAAALFRCALTCERAAAETETYHMLEPAADKRPDWLVAAAAAGVRLRLRRASASDVLSQSLAADEVLRAVAAVCTKRGAPSFDGGFQSFEGTADDGGGEWRAAAKAATLVRRSCRGVSLLALVGGLDGSDVLEAVQDIGGATAEARAAAVASKAAAVALNGEGGQAEFERLNDLLEDEDADVLDDLEIFFGDGDDPENEVVVRGARLVAETTAGGAAVAASAAARMELFRSALTKGNNDRALTHARRLIRAARAVDAQDDDDSECRNCRDVVCELAVDCAIRVGDLPASSDRDALLLNALQLPAHKAASTLVETVARALATGEPERAPLDAAADCLRGAASHAEGRSCLLDAACGHLLKETSADAIQKASDALNTLDGELRRRHPASVRPAPALVDELVALGFEAAVARRACRATNTGSLETRVAFCLRASQQPEAREQEPESDGDDAGDASCARKAAAFYLATCAARDATLGALCAEKRAALARRRDDADDALALKRALAPEPPASPPRKPPASPPRSALRGALAHMLAPEPPAPKADSPSKLRGALARLVAPEAPAAAQRPSMVEEPRVEDVTQDVDAQRSADGAALNVDLERFEREDVYRGEALVKAAQSANGAAFRAALKAARRPIAGATPALRAASAPDGLAKTHLSRWFDDAALRSPAGEVDKLTPVLYEADGSARVAIDVLNEAGGLEAWLTERYWQETDAPALALVCGLASEHCDGDFAAVCRVQAPILKRYAKCVRPLNASVACKPLLGEVVASPPNILEEADDPPRNPPAPGARVATAADVRRDRAISLLRRIANYRTAAALATFAAKGFDPTLQLGGADVYAAAFRRELFDAIKAEGAKALKGAGQRVSPLLQRCAKAAPDIAAGALGACVFESVGGPAVAHLRAVVAALNCDPLGPHLATLGKGLEAVESVLPFGVDREALNAAKLAYERDEKVVDAAIELAHALAVKGAPASLIHRAFLLVTDVAGLDATAAAAAAADDACAHALAAALRDRVVAPLFGGEEPSPQDVERRVAVASQLVESASSNSRSATMLASKLRGVEGYWRGLRTAAEKMQRPVPAATADRLRAIGLLTRLGSETDDDQTYYKVAEVVARALGAERMLERSDLERPEALVRDVVAARDAVAVRELCAVLFPGTGQRGDVALATLKGDDFTAEEPGGQTWLAALDAAKSDDAFLRELGEAPANCAPSEKAEAAFYNGLAETPGRIVVGLRAAHPTTRLRAAREAAATKCDAASLYLVQSGALLAALETDAVWARAACVAHPSPLGVAQLLLCGRARSCHADFLAAARCASLNTPVALRGGFELCGLALEDASLDPTLKEAARAALGAYLAM